MVGLVDGVLADRAFVDDRQSTAAELGSVDDLRDPAPHMVANALAAAALARAHGVSRLRCATGCAVSRSGRIASRSSPRSAACATSTTPRPPTRMPRSRPCCGVDGGGRWIAGGLAKGATFDDLVVAARDRLRGVVLIGADRAVVAEALAATRAGCAGRRGPDREG